MSTTNDNVERMVELVRSGEITDFVRQAHDFEPADLADVLAALDEEERVAVVQALPAELSSQALAEMPEGAHAEDTLAALSPERAAEIVEELEDDDAADMLRDLAPEARASCLSLHAFCFFMGQGIGPIIYGDALVRFGKLATLSGSAAVMVISGVSAAWLLNRPPANKTKAF